MEGRGEKEKEQKEKGPGKREAASPSVPTGAERPWVLESSQAEPSGAARELLEDAAGPTCSSLLSRLSAQPALGSAGSGLTAASAGERRRRTGFVLLGQ